MLRSIALAYATKRMACDKLRSTVYLACHGNQDGPRLHGWDEVADLKKLRKMQLEDGDARGMGFSIFVRSKVQMSAASIASGP